MSETILELRDVSKSFPGVTALDHISFEVGTGEVHGLVGENGAGKSTLIKIVSGATAKDQGSIFVAGEEVEYSSPLDARNLGISVVYQELSLISNLTVAENIFLGHEPVLRSGFVDWETMFQLSEERLSALGLQVDPRMMVRHLSIAQAQMVEIAKALSANARIIFLDEPTAVLSKRDADVLFNTIRSLKEKGITFIYVSHRLEEIFGITDRVSVLRDGRLVDTVPTCTLDKEKLIRMMVGREVKDVQRTQAPEHQDSPFVCLKDVRYAENCRGVNLKVSKGEILGVAGLVGSGRTELARAVFGADRLQSGQIYIDGKLAHIKSCGDAIELGLGLAPEDRKNQGLVTGMTVRENISLANLPTTRFGFIRSCIENELYEKHQRSLRIKTSSPSQKVLNLSGGNQQKVVLAKWLSCDLEVVILDEPTRGVDVGAKLEIYEIIFELATQGRAIIVISSDLPELLSVSDRIIVMREGEVVDDMKRSEATQERILRKALEGDTHA